MKYRYRIAAMGMVCLWAHGAWAQEAPAMKFMPLDTYRMRPVQRVVPLGKSQIPEKHQKHAAADIIPSGTIRTPDGKMSEQQAKQILSIFAQQD